MHFLKEANVRFGQSLLIYGAGGSIGTYAVQIAKAWGAQVTAVDSAEKLAMLGSIGVDRVMDYMKEDFTSEGETYDVIIDVVGKSSFSKSLTALKPNGRYVLGNPSLSDRLKARRSHLSMGRQVVVAVASYKNEYYTLLNQLFARWKN